ncbi:MAG TPA: HypC/HybG/HupF family hydrogenase formation chaperone [Candidatus Aphodovivens avistercoris]|nr:HypC/HybG/HupF family hydrogenase formation chaperone [Candidatus Aphodovivens avistercoris]
MCLAIPAKITELKEDRLATVDILGVKRDIALDLTPQAQEGDFVLVHAGFAIEVVDAQYAQETIDLIKEFPELAGDEAPQPQPAAAEALR